MKNSTYHSIKLAFLIAKRYLGIALFTAIAGAILSTTNLKAQGNMLLTPKRVVFERNKTSESINLANSGTDTTRYVISLIHLRMKEDGTIEEISQADAGQLSAEPYVRYFPRTVKLAPNEAQVIRMQLNNSVKMIPGEYRSHLYVRALNKPTPLGTKEAIQSETIGVKLVPVFGISIPVIVRVGESKAGVSITGPSLKITATDHSILSLILNRSGDMSLYGDITVKHIDPNGKTIQVCIVKGLAVYTPNLTRTIDLELDNNSLVNYRKGKLVVQFISQVDGKDKKLAESELGL